MAELLLNYAVQPTKAQLEEFEGGVRLTFPVMRRRMGWINIIAVLFAAIAQTSVVGWDLWLWRSVQQQIASFPRVAGQNMPVIHFPISEIAISVFWAILVWTAAILTFRRTRLQLTQPEFWEATANELIVWRFNSFGLKRSAYHPVGVSSVKATPIRDIFGKKDLVLLAIEFNNGQRRIARRMSGADSLVARQAARAFRKILSLSDKEDSCQS